METALNREGYGRELVCIGEKKSDVVVLEADISTSTKTCYFAEKFPERFINVGVAEQNEVMMAAGIASCGLIPFVSTYSAFSSMRSCEQIRSFVCYPKLNVKFGVSHGGFTACTDGVTHQATEDIAILRAMPNMSLFVPSDYYSAQAAARAALQIDGPVYMRLTRDKLPILYDENLKLEIGKSILLHEGKDITIIAIGDMVHIALQAVEELESSGISTRLIDMQCVKPIDKAAIIKAAAETRGIVTAEDHQINGGLGSAVAEVLIENKPIAMKRIGIPDTFGESGDYQLLLKKYGMSSDHIAEACRNILA